MLTGQFKLLQARPLEASGSFPASVLLSLYDEEAGETLNLVADRAIGEAVAAREPLSDVVLRLRWRRLDLSSMGGRGKAYRLSVAEVVDE